MDLTIAARKIEIIKAFNERPKNGIKLINEICKEHGLDLAQETANFFFEEKKNLDQTAVGDYLGSANVIGEKNEETLAHFVKQLDFTGQPFVKSLRHYFTTFELPGEAQKVDRIVKAFADTYYQQNFEGDIKSADSAHILAFQAMMLTTDLHNSNIDENKRMTLGGLTRNLRDLNDGKDFDSEFLKQYYNDIKAIPLGFKTVKTIPGFELDTENLTSDKTYKKLSKALSKENINTTQLFPQLKDSTIEISQPKAWLNKLTGYKGSVNITDKEGTKTSIQLYEPDIFSSWFKGAKPSVIVQPICEEGKPPSSKSLKMAAIIAASFSSNVKITATYDYLKEDMTQSYNHMKEFEKTKITDKTDFLKASEKIGERMLKKFTTSFNKGNSHVSKSSTENNFRSR